MTHTQPPSGSVEIAENEMLAVGEVLLRACASDKGVLHPWKPFDVANVARECIAAYLAALPPASPAVDEVTEHEFAQAMADVFANGWSYGTHPVDKARILYHQAISAGYTITRTGKE